MWRFLTKEISLRKWERHNGKINKTDVGDINRKCPKSSSHHFLPESDMDWKIKRFDYLMLRNKCSQDSLVAQFDEKLTPNTLFKKR